MITAFAMANRGDESQLIHEGAMTLFKDDQHFLRAAGNFRRATGAWQAYLGLVIVTNHRGIDVAELVDLRSAEEADVNAPTLQPVTENLAGRHYGVSGFGQLAVTDGQWQHSRFGADGAGLVNQHHFRGMGQARQVGRLGWQADADEADAAVAQIARSRHGHHFIGVEVAHHLASAFNFA